MGSTRYPDAFRNALMDSHEMSVRAELWYNDALVGQLNVVSGSVSCDRQASVRRTASIRIDPSAVTDPAIGPRLNPYGSMVKVWRGVRYPGGHIEDTQIFTGRIDSMEESLSGVDLRCSDQSAMVVDSRFTGQKSAADFAPGALVRDVAKALIQEVLPTATVNFDSAVNANPLPLAPGTTFDQERSDALDSLTTQLNAEWFADATGVFFIAALPSAIQAGTDPVWIVDGGDSGVLIERVSTTDRTNIANAVFVTAEAIGGVTPAQGFYEITMADDPLLYWGGPYGKIPKFYTGQQIVEPTTQKAMDLAKALAAQEMAAVSSIRVQCVVNPRLMLGDVVRVFDPRTRLDRMMFVQQMTVPLGPAETMNMTLYRGIITGSGGGLREAPLTLAPGMTWRPSWDSA